MHQSQLSVRPLYSPGCGSASRRFVCSPTDCPRWRRPSRNRLRYRIGYLSETYRAERLRRTVRRSGSLRGERYEPRLDDRHADGDHFRPGNTSSRRGGRERFMRRHGGDVLDEALTAVQLLSLGLQFFGDGRRLWGLLNVDSEGQGRLRNSSSFCWRLFLMRVITWSRLLVRLLLVRRRVKTSFMHRHFLTARV